MGEGVGPLQITASARPRDVPEIRRALSAWLAELPEHALPADRITHAVGEAVTNAVEHAYSEGAEGEGRIDVDAAIVVDHLVVRVRDYGMWREREGAGSPRGLDLMRTLADEVTVHPSDTGSEVRLQWRYDR